MLIGLAMLYVLPFVYRAFHALRYPIIITTVGGLVLGILGFIGGPITMFKGLAQMGELLQNADDYDAGQLAVISGIKIVALLVAACALFRGGRIFPATFIGAALGLLGNTLFPSIPLGLAVACGIIGILVVVARDGWLALFVAAAVAGDLTLLPMLCMIILPAWLPSPRSRSSASCRRARQLRASAGPRHRRARALRRPDRPSPGGVGPRRRCRTVGTLSLMTTLVLTVVGDDRQGLVAAVADVVDAHGGNWENSELAELAGAFAGIIEVSVAAGRVTSFAPRCPSSTDCSPSWRTKAPRRRMPRPPADSRSACSETITRASCGRYRPRFARRDSASSG